MSNRSQAQLVSPLNQADQVSESSQEKQLVDKGSIVLNQHSRKPNPALSHYNLGLALAKKGRLEEAIYAYKKATEVDPKLAKAYHSLGEALSQKEQWQEAVEVYQKAIQLNPKISWSYNSLGNALFKLEQFQEAVKAYQKAIALNPDCSWSHNSLGDTFLRLNHWEKAVELYQKAIELNPDFHWSYYNLGEVLTQLEKWDEAVVTYRQALELNPELPELEQKLNHALHQQVKSSLQAALSCYRQAIAQDPGDIESYHKALEIEPDDPELHLGLGNALGEKGDTEKAITCYQQAISIDPRCVEGYRKLSEIYEKNGQLEEATHFRLQQLNLEPDFTKAEEYFKLGKTLQQLGKTEEAVNYYRQAIQYNPNLAEAHFHLGEWLSIQQEWEVAVSAYQNAINTGLHSSDCYHKLGDTFLILGRWEEATNAFHKATELNSNYNWSYYNLGEVLSKQGKWHEAIIAYQQALKIQPDMPYVTEKLNYAMHQRLKENVTEAIHFYNQVTEQKPEETHNVFYSKVYDRLKKVLKLNILSSNTEKNADYFYILGESLFKQESWSKSIRNLRQAFELHPRSDQVWCQSLLGSASNQVDLEIEIKTNKASINTDITIIIPIYNAYEDTKQCIAALLKNTDPKYDILLIDDCSPDTRVTEFVKQVAQEVPQVTCIKNPQNLGFVKTCNFAFQITEGEDVIILNSDTMVTPGWLEKLTAVAYSNELIASVTPLTNNGEICSVPSWLEYNDIPENHTVETFGKLIEEISLHRYPTIPTCVGFCTYMKREIFDRIGFFDEMSFGRGYGEENDWSRRAIEAGYYHVIDDSTFVYHSGGKSFGVEEKEQLVLDNFAPLKNKHPDYFQEIHEFINAKPVQDIINNVQLQLKLNEIRKQNPICFIIHNNPDIPVNFPLGGTEYHCLALIQEIRQTQPIYTLCFNQVDGSLLLNIFLPEEVMRFEFPCPLPPDRSRQYQNPEFLRVFVEIMQYFKPGLIHLHHIINLPILDLIEGLKQLKISYALTLHDYYFICPNHSLIDYQGEFCYEKKNDQYCRNCIQKSWNEGEELKQNWHNLCQKLMSDASKLFAPSDTTRSYFAKEYPQLADKVQVIRHGIMKESELEANLKNRESTQRSSDCLPLKIAFVGGIDVKKGLNVIIDLLQAVATRKDLQNCLEFELHGATSHPIPDSINNLKVYDTYTRENLPSLLESVDLVMFPGIWPETYCLVADEVLALGIPVIATPLGAIAERINKYKVGWVSQSSDVNDLLEVLTFLVNHPEELTQVQESIKQYPVVSFESMANQYLEEYSQLKTDHLELESHQSGIELRQQMLFFAHLKAQWYFLNR